MSNEGAESPGQETLRRLSLKVAFHHDTNGELNLF
jgi:hypothetical protein